MSLGASSHTIRRPGGNAPFARTRGTLLVLLCACGSPAVTADGGGPAPLRWEPCGDGECACLEVPLSYDEPSLGTTSVCAKRLSALDPENRAGTLFVLEGGPGVSGISNAEGIRAAILAGSEELAFAERFDVVAFDRRGVGRSDGFACVDEAFLLEARDAPWMPSSDDEWARIEDMWRRFGEGCAGATSVPFLAHLGSDTFARDLDRFREALGEERIHLLGISHGTLAVAAYATLFPERVIAGVLDAPVLPYGSPLTSFLERSLDAREAALGAFFERCGADPECQFHGGAGAEGVRAAYDGLSARLAAAPLALPDGRPFGARSLAFAVTISIGSDPSGFGRELAPRLASVEAGDAEPLDIEVAAHHGRLPSGGYSPARFSIARAGFIAEYGCPFTSLDGAREHWLEVASRAPRLGGTAVNGSLACAGWPAPRPPPIRIDAARSPPLLVVAAVHELVTPLSMAEAMLEALGNGSHLLRRESDRHVSFTSRCAATEIVRYLLDPSGYAPPDLCP